MLRRTMLLGALASCSLIAAGAGARADYTYTTTTAVGNPVPVGTQSAVNFTGTNSVATLTGTNQINVQNVGMTSTKPIATPDTGSFTLSFTLNLTQTNGPLINQPTGTGSTTITGTFNVTRADIGGETSNIVFNAIPSVTIAGVVYTFSNPVYAAPTINFSAGGLSDGNISILVTPTVVPEPASVVMMGAGLAGLGGLGLVRARKSRRS